MPIPRSKFRDSSFILGLMSVIDRLQHLYILTVQDHWVANDTRDALIAARAAKGEGGAGSKPIMLIDNNGIDHAFSISELPSRLFKFADECQDIVRALLRRLMCGSMTSQKVLCNRMNYSRSKYQSYQTLSLQLTISCNWQRSRIGFCSNVSFQSK